MLKFSRIRCNTQATVDDENIIFRYVLCLHVRIHTQITPCSGVHLTKNIPNNTEEALRIENFKAIQNLK